MTILVNLLAAAVIAATPAGPVPSAPASAHEFTTLKVFPKFILGLDLDSLAFKDLDTAPKITLNIRMQAIVPVVLPNVPRPAGSYVYTAQVNCAQDMILVIVTRIFDVKGELLGVTTTPFRLENPHNEGSPVTAVVDLICRPFGGTWPQNPGEKWERYKAPPGVTIPRSKKDVVV